jgi:crotonobetainyl-CoA:carnitine CoA-transferase CaiB-like acyl-CoA transferase
MGNSHPSTAPCETLLCADGEMVLGAGNELQFARCCTVLGLPDLHKDPRFATNGDRLLHRSALRAALTGALLQAPRAHWLAAFEAVGVRASSVQTVAEALPHPQTRARDMLWPLDPAQPNGLMSVASPLKLSHTPVRHRFAPPSLGADTDSALAALGVSADRLLALMASGAIAGNPSLPPGLGMDGGNTS